MNDSKVTKIRKFDVSLTAGLTASLTAVIVADDEKSALNKFVDRLNRWAKGELPEREEPDARVVEPPMPKHDYNIEDIQVEEIDIKKEAEARDWIRGIDDLYEQAEAASINFHLFKGLSRMVQYFQDNQWTEEDHDFLAYCKGAVLAAEKQFKAKKS